jgi:hypothetical protein
VFTVVFKFLYAVLTMFTATPEHEVTPMAVQKNTRGPYASTGSILKVIEKHRQVGLQTMSLQRLQQIGITEALAPRTLHSLTFLGFYGENGDVTPEFDALRRAPEHEFKPRLAALLREAYASILEVLDPETATVLDVENAFRGFEPTGQIPRMVQLFMGLMIYADLMPEDRRKPSAGGGRPPGSRAGSGAASKKKDKDAASGAAPASPVRETPAEAPPPVLNGHATGAEPARENTYVLYLASGPKITLMVDMDVMRVSISDREFIFKLVDALREYDMEPDEASGGAAKIAG